MPASFTNRAGMQVTIESSDLTKVQRQLKALGADSKPTRRALNKRLKVAAKPAAEDAKRAVRAAPVRGPKSTGLRQEIAAGIKVKVSTSSVRIVSTGRLAKEMEGVAPWRHPVFGRDTWVSQEADPTFFRTVESHKLHFQAEAEKAMDDALREAGL